MHNKEGTLTVGPSTASYINSIVYCISSANLHLLPSHFLSIALKYILLAKGVVVTDWTVTSQDGRLQGGEPRQKGNRMTKEEDGRQGGGFARIAHRPGQRTVIGQTKATGDSWTSPAIAQQRITGLYKPRSLPDTQIVFFPLLSSS